MSTAERSSDACPQVVNYSHCVFTSTARDHSPDTLPGCCVYASSLSVTPDLTVSCLSRKMRSVIIKSVLIDGSAKPFTDNAEDLSAVQQMAPLLSVLSACLNKLNKCHYETSQTAVDLFKLTCTMELEYFKF